jgi:ABC-2 type transport system permease protein
VTAAVRRYGRIFWFAARDQIIYLPSFLVRNVFFVVIVFIFWSLWRVVFAGRAALGGLTIVQTLWYLTFTETVELSKSRVLFQVQEEVKDGTVSVTLAKPYSYPLFQLARAMGESVVKIVPLLLEGLVLGTLFVGPLPGYLASLPFGIVLIVMGLLITNLWLLLVGLISFWTEETAPFSWIIQKLVFILGGLFLPINLFPAWLAGVARYLPFAFSAYWPAYAMVSGERGAFLFGLAGAAAYVVVLGVAVALLFSTGRRRIHAQGG